MKKTFIMVLLILGIVLGMSGMAWAATVQDLVTSVPEGSTVSVANDSAYPWVNDAALSGSSGYVVYKAGAAIKPDPSSSSLTISVTGDGILSFDYYTGNLGRKSALRLEDGDSSTPDQLANTKGTWQTVSINIPEDSATPYCKLTYDKPGGDSPYVVAVRNIRFVSGKVSVTYDSSNSSWGSVTGTAESGAGVKIGTEITLTAVPADGAQFYGWVDPDGNLLGEEPVLKVSPSEDMTVTAVMEQAGSQVARYSGFFYSDLQAALSAAKADNSRKGQVILIDDAVISGTVNVPVGVTLLLPYNDAALKATEITKDTSVTSPVFAWLDEEKYLKHTLTIPSDAVLDVDGTVLVGGVRMYAGQNALQGHTSGAYSQIINNGTIALDGDMEIYGLVKGNGTFTAAAESEILEPFVLVDYAGGTNTMALFETGKQFPFGQFCFANIQCDLTMYQGAELKGIAGIFALGGLHEVSGVGVVGSSENASDAMIQLGEGGVMHHSLDTSKFFTVTKSGKSAAIPKSVLKLTGNAGIGTMALSVEGVGSFSSADIYLGLPYNFDVTLDDGDFEIADGVKCRILPGSCVTIEDGAVLTVKEALMVYDGLHDEYGRAGIVYPWENQLTEAGFASSGMLTVNGTLVLADGSSFGGVIQTGGRSGKISVGENVTLNSNIQFGCESVDVSMGGTSQNNLAFHDLSARIRMRNGSLVMLQNGKEYKAVGNTAWELTSYAEQRTSDTAMNVYEKALPQAMKGVWAENNGEEILLGDVNLDNEVDAADLTALARHVAKIQTLKDEAALANADVTGEGELDAADLTKLARYVAKIISQL